MTGTNPHDSSEQDANCDIVRVFLRTLCDRDTAAFDTVVAENIVRVGPRPSFVGGGPLEDDRGVPAVGRAVFRGHIDANAHFRPGSMWIELERLLAEGPYVAAQFTLHGTTRHDQAYENFYHYLFECRGGQIHGLWQYLDTLYSSEMLFGSTGSPAGAAAPRASSPRDGNYDTPRVTPTSLEHVEQNKRAVTRFSEAMSGNRDIAALTALFTEDAARVGPRPMAPPGATVQGREAMLAGFAEHRYFAPGSMLFEIERLVGDGEYVAAQFKTTARTRSEQRYENYYHFLFLLDDGQIKKYWEYIDTLYAQKMLFS
jgi:ketosteroid isomerase-like protein